MCKKFDGIPGEGTSIATALWVAETYGICEDKYFPNDVFLDPNVYEDASLIPAEAFENAKLHKIKDYKWVQDLAFNGLRNAIFQNDIVIVGMDISDAWWTTPDGRVSWAGPDILPLRPPQPSTSRHCIDLYCYNRDEKLDGLMNWWRGTAFSYGRTALHLSGCRNLHLGMLALLVPPIVSLFMFGVKPLAGLNWFDNGAQNHPFLRVTLILLSLLGIVSTHFLAGAPINPDSVSQLVMMLLETGASAYGSHLIYRFIQWVKEPRVGF